MAPYWMWLCLVFLLSLGSAAAQELELFKPERLAGGPWWIRAEKISYDVEGHTYEAQGRVEIRQGERRLLADRVQVNEVTKIAVFAGNVVMIMEEDIFTGQEGRFNLATRTGEMHEARLFMKRNHFKVESPLIRKTGENTYYAEKSTVTTCDADLPVWSFAAGSLNVTLEGYALAHNTLVRVAGVPVLYFPFAVLPVMTTRQTGFLLPSFGQHRAGGTVVELPLYWAINNHADATFYQTYLTNRGYMQGGEFRQQGHQNTASNFRLFYLSDHESQKVSTPHRYWAAGMTNQNLPGDVSLRLTLDRVSDAAYLKDFNFGYMGLNRYSRDLLQEMGRDLEQEEVPTRVSNLLLARNFSWANLTAYGRYYQRLNDTDPRPYQRLPGLAFQSVPQPLGGLPLYLGLDSSYGYFHQDRGMNGDRLDFHPQLWLQGQPLPGFAFSSRVGFRETLFRVDHSNQGKIRPDPATPENPPEQYIDRQLFDAKVSLASAWSRDYGRDSSSILFYRHTLRPEITYWNMPRYDAHRYPNFDPFDQGWVVRANRNLPIREGDDPLGGVNALTYGIGSNLLKRDQNRQGQATVTDLLWLRVSQSAFFNTTSMALDGTDLRHHRFSDFLGEAEIYPLRQLTLGMNMGVSSYNEGFTRANVKAAFQDARKQNYISVDYLFIKDFAQQINVTTYLNLMRSMKTWFTFGHTFQTDKRLEKRYGLILQRQCLGVVLSYTERPDDKRVGFTLFIPGLGEKIKRSPVRFPEEGKQGKESPDAL
jgi:LPS-assembly protein